MAVAVDTSAVIASLHGGEPASAAATWLFDRRIGQAQNSGLISAITMAELLVGPAAEHDATIVVTNDRRWVPAARALRLPLETCLLDDYVTGSRS